MDISDFFKQHGDVAVAFSGGVDSAVLLLLAKKYAARVKAYYAKSQFQPQFELDDAREIAALLGADLDILPLDVLSCGEIAANPANRCYYCKKRIFGEIIARAKADGFETVVDGTNASDDISDRPGFAALGEMSVLSPLQLCGITKAEIRKIAKESALPVWGKPSYACLATRIPTGEEITAEALKTTEEAEGLLKSEGFNNFRIRYIKGAARLELGRAERELYKEKQADINALLLRYYESVCPDIKERADE